MGRAANTASGFDAAATVTAVGVMKSMLQQPIAHEYAATASIAVTRSLTVTQQPITADD